MQDHVKELVSELTLLGLKPTVSITGGNHQKVEWEVGGKTYSLITSLTPSDWRTRLNDRARLRRRLRELGLYKPQTPSLNGSSPIPVLGLEQRIQQLELDVVALLDMIESGGTYQAGWNAATFVVTDALREHGPRPVEKPEKTSPAAKVSPRLRQLLLQMPVGEWLAVKELKRRYGKQNSMVSVMLNKLKRQNLVEHDKKVHKWRKRAEAVL